MLALSGWVIIEPIENKEIGGLVLPDSFKTETQSGKVVSIPEDKTYINNGVEILIPHINIDDIVSFRKYYAYEVEDNQKKYLAVHFENLICTL